MLRHNIDTMINKGPFSDVSNSFLFGFSTTIISFMTVLMLIVVMFRMFRQMDVIKQDTNEFVVFVKHYLRQQRLVLPLYYDLAFRKKEKEDEENDKTEKPTFVIPPLDTEHCELMMEEESIPPPPSSLTKRKTLSSNNLFGQEASHFKVNA